MEWVETTGRTIEEAKDAALDQLGVDEQDAEFEILEEPKSGLFGRLRQEARVRARVRPTAPRAKSERRDRSRRNGRKRAGGQEADTRDATSRLSVETPSSEPTKPNSSAKAPRQRIANQEGAVVETDKTLADQGEIARKFVGGLLDAFDLDGSVEFREVDDETIEIAVTGEGLGLLVGPRGSTLSAVQELSRTALQHALGGSRGARLRVDVAGYWERRRDALARFAQQVAAQVLESGSPVALEPMDAADRKIVHDTVNTIDGVETLSEGEAARRHVIIRPS